MDAFLDALPRLATALAVLVVGWVAGAMTRRLVRPQLRRRRAPSFSAVVSKLIGWAVGVAGTIVAVTIAFPSVQPVDVLAGLGVFSIAAGLAFQDILSNLLAGLLLIFRQPFVSGDQIAVGEHEGTVEEISIRETSIRQPGLSFGQRLVQALFGKPRVNTVQRNLMATGSLVLVIFFVGQLSFLVGVCE